MYDEMGGEDSYLDASWEDRFDLDHLQDPFDIDPFWEYEDELGLDELVDLRED